MLNNIGLPGLLLIAVVVLVLFGRGKISDLMGDVAKGLKSFKKGMAEDDEPESNPAEPRQIPRDEKTIDVEVTRDRDQTN